MMSRPRGVHPVADFELDGRDGTWLLRDRTSNYSVALIGSPTVCAGTDDVVRYDVIVKLGDVEIEYGVRIDDIPAPTDPKALAETLAFAYAKNRALGAPPVSNIPEPYLPTGAVGGAKAQYRLRGSETEIERVWIATKASPTGVWALYFTTRANLEVVNPIGWSHLLSTLNGQHRWGDDLPRTPIWPTTSSIALPKAELELTDAAYEDARAMARDLVGHEIGDTVIGTLSRLAQTDEPPAATIDQARRETARAKISTLLAPKTAEILFRDLERCETMLDFRGWVWQCVWAIGNVGA